MFQAEAPTLLVLGHIPKSAEPLGCPALQDLALRILQSAGLEELWVMATLA